jgi:hypothetical protein
MAIIGKNKAVVDYKTKMHFQRILWIIWFVYSPDFLDNISNRVKTFSIG